MTVTYLHAKKRMTMVSMSGVGTKRPHLWQDDLLMLG